MNQPPHLAIGPRIRQLRQQLRLTQSAIAEEFGTSQSAISAMEVGDTQPGLDFLVWLAEKAGTSVEYLVTGRSPSAPDDESRPSRDNLREVVAEVIAELSAGHRGEKIGEPAAGYVREGVACNELENRLLRALRRLDPERQERIVSFAEDLAGACDAPPIPGQEETS